MSKTETIKTLQLAKEYWKLIDRHRSKESSRIALQGIYIQDRVIYATDGRRLLEIHNQVDDLPNGNYKILSTNKVNSKMVEVILTESPDQYPNIEQVKVENPKIVNTINIEKCGIGLSSNIITIFQSTGRAICLYFIENLIFGKYENKWDILIDKGEKCSDKPIILKTTNIEVLILPFKYDN